MSSVRLVHFTDPHLYGSESEQLRGIATYPALTSTLAHAREQIADAQALLVTGDIVQDDPGGYALFRSVFAPLAKPVLCLPGNHDIQHAWRRELAGPPFHTGSFYDLNAWRIVLLDSCIPGSAGGHLAPTELARLDELLGSTGGRHALVCLHHHPVPMASRWLDEVGLDNADEFFDVIDRHRNVKAVLWGHVHQKFDGLRKGVRLLATPSTCRQFLPGSDDFAIDALPPAYRTLELRSTGAISTDLVWVDEWSDSSSRSSWSVA